MPINLQSRKMGTRKQKRQREYSDWKSRITRLYKVHTLILSGKNILVRLILSNFTLKKDIHIAFREDKKNLCVQYKYNWSADRKITNSRKAGSDDLSLIAGSLASSHAGKPPKSHSTTKGKWENGKM